MDAPVPTTTYRIALFPLRAVLFPGGLLPLRIFEVRYLDMIGRCHKAGQPFGVVCLTEGHEVRRPGGPPASERFHPIGTLAAITQLDRPQPGLMEIRCTGQQRFRLHASEQLQHGLWMGEAEWLPDDTLVKVPPDLAYMRRSLQQLVHQLNLRVERGEELPLRMPYQWDDCGWLANRWSELLPIGVEQKQRLMSLDNPLLRLELVSEILDDLRADPPMET